MACLSTIRALALASLSDNSQPPKTRTPKPSLPRTKKPALPGKQKRSLKKGSETRPSLIQIERAIGAGRYRDIDRREEEAKKTEFDGLLPITTGQFETTVEETLRKTGRWLADKTARSSGSAGKGVLLFLFRYILPVWTLLILLGIGVIKLPFNTPFLDDLFM
uniref:Chlororespiratory reduction 3 n=1 Tax=California macrophylla TaxID=337344 RepID=A0A0F7CZ70_9ROSI